MSGIETNRTHRRAAAPKPDFERLHHFLSSLYGSPEGLDLAAGSGLKVLFDNVLAAFTKAAGKVYRNKAFSAKDLALPEMKALTNATYQALNNALQSGIRQEIPEAMAEALRKDVFVFSGMKVYTSLREVGSLDFTDENGKPKSRERFMRDADKLNVKYNRHYLNTEYNFTKRSAQQVDKWQQIEKDGDAYLLQYRTAEDDKVRQSHAEMDNITLPPSDAFWNNYYPPNGWNCRCVAVQVRKGKYPESDPDTAMAAGDKATTQIGKDGSNKAAMFRFNPGKDKRIFPKDHPYTSGDCGNLAAVWHTLSRNERILLANAGDKCRAKKEVGKQYKSNLAERRIAYEKIMSPLMKKSVTKQVAPDKKITVKFNKKGNAHIVDDLLNKKGIRLGKKDLDKLHQYLKEAEYKKSSDLYKQRKDNIRRFYYFKDEKRNIYYNIAETAKREKRGKIKLERFLYSVTNAIPTKK